MGLATAQLLASRGATVSLADRNEAGLAAALKTLEGTGHITTVIDVRDSKTVNGWIQKTVKQLGKLDGAVNMAGIFTIDTPIRDETDEGWDTVMDVNAKGVFYCVRAELNHMSKGGSIVSVSLSVSPLRQKLTGLIYGQVSAASVDGQIGFPNIGTYCASKHAVIGMTRSAAKENPDIRINCVAPGKCM